MDSKELKDFLEGFRANGFGARHVIKVNSDFEGTPVAIKVSFDEKDIDGTFEVSVNRLGEECAGAGHKEFSPYEEVLVKNGGVWEPDLYSYWNEDDKSHETFQNSMVDDKDIIEYDAELAGKKSDE